MRLALVLVSSLVACSPAPRSAIPATPAVAIANDAVPGAVEVVPDAAEAPVGAVPIPGTYETSHSIRHADTTVLLAELPAPDAAWRERKSLAYKGPVTFALHVAGHEGLALTVVDTVTETETGYPYGMDDFPLGRVDDGDSPDDGNAFPVRDLDPETGALAGPIMFAVRVQQRQVVVYFRDRTIFVAERALGVGAWTPRLRIDVPKSTQLLALNPGWH